MSKLLIFLGAIVALTACGGGKSETEQAPGEAAEAPLPPAEIETGLPPSVRDAVLKPFTGDLDALVKRRAVRIGVAFNRTFYFVDRGKPRGIAYEYGQVMQERLNRYYHTDTATRFT